jgi:hypothetical protein
VKLNLGYFLAILILFSTRSTGQVLHEQRSQAFGNSPVSRPPITNQQRLNWFVRSTVGPESLTAGLFTAGFGTGLNRPREYGPHWEGYGKRYGMRFTGIATGNAMEAALGSLWGEDPRYFRATGQSVKRRIKNVIVMTFVARQDDGTIAPAYARYIGTSGNNFLSNTWRADSESGVGDACLRTALGFAGRMGGNAFAEFWPTVTKHLFHKRD